MNRNQQSATKVHRPSKRQQSYRGIAGEVWLKLILSWIIAIASIGSLIKLLPYHFSQQAKLKEIRTQVGQTEARVKELRHQLNHNFDPEQTQSLMEQYSSLLAPNRSRIYWLPEAEKNLEQ